MWIFVADFQMKCHICSQLFVSTVFCFSRLIHSHTSRCTHCTHPLSVPIALGQENAMIHSLFLPIDKNIEEHFNAFHCISEMFSSATLSLEAHTRKKKHTHSLYNPLKFGAYFVEMHQNDVITCAIIESCRMCFLLLLLFIRLSFD